MRLGNLALFVLLGTPFIPNTVLGQPDFSDRGRMQRGDPIVECFIYRMVDGPDTIDPSDFIPPPREIEICPEELRERHRSSRDNQDNRVSTGRAESPRQSPPRQERPSESTFDAMSCVGYGPSGGNVPPSITNSCNFSIVVELIARCNGSPIIQGGVYISPNSSSVVEPWNCSHRDGSTFSFNVRSATRR